MTAIPPTVVVPRADEVWGDPPTAQQGRQLAADRSDCLDFSSIIPDTSSFIVRMGNFGCFYLNLRESPGKL
jgi:hypothetical protein